MPTVNPMVHCSSPGLWSIVQTTGNSLFAHNQLGLHSLGAHICGTVETPNKVGRPFGLSREVALFRSFFACFLYTAQIVNMVNHKQNESLESGIRTMIE